MRLIPLRLVSVAVLVLLLGGSPAAASADDRRAVGHVYVLNNNLSGQNSITVFDRAANGALTQRGVTPIGGMGSLAAFADGTQGSIIETPDHTRVFAVDAGSDQISVLDVKHGDLSLVGVFPSGGAGPVSLTYGGGLLYVLNAANASTAAANVTGFRVHDDGHLTPIAGSTRPLSSAHPNPAQVQLSPDRHDLLVTEKATSLIDIYRVGESGSLGALHAVPSVGAIPFGMAFRRGHLGDDDGDRDGEDEGDHHEGRGHDDERQPVELVVADAGGAGPNFAGAATAYRLIDTQLRVINGPVADHQIAPCWMVITRNGRFAYTSNADSFSISGYRIGNDGVISLLNPPDGVTATTPRDTFPIEESLSRNSRFLYVLDSRLLLPAGPGPATLSGFHIEGDGRLTPIIDPARFTLPFSAIGQTAD